MYKPYHAIGLELGISVASAGLRREPTGQAQAWHGDVVATAKRDLAAGETLDGEGGFTVYGKLVPAAASLAIGGLPLGLAHGVMLKRAVAANTPVHWDDVAIDESQPAGRVPPGDGAGVRLTAPAGRGEAMWAAPDRPGQPGGRYAARRNVARAAPAATNRAPKVRLSSPDVVRFAEHAKHARGEQRVAAHHDEVGEHQRRAAEHVLDAPAAAADR